MAREKEWKTLAEVFTEIEADIICGLLDSENIGCEKEYTGPFPGMKVIFGQENGFSIKVSAEDFDRAMRLIEEESKGEVSQDE